MNILKITKADLNANNEYIGGDLIENGLPEQFKQTDATTDAINLLKANGYQIIKN